jgi:hypothetical protein
MRLMLLASAALLLPAAAVAQETKPATPPATTAPAPTAPPQSTAPGQTETTPGQQQTTPGEASDLTPAVTGQTPSGQTTGQTQTAPTEKVAKADVKAGATVFDSAGDTVGTIKSVSAKSAVLDTGKVKVTIPLTSLAKSEKGLLVGMSKAEIEAAAKKKG